MKAGVYQKIPPVHKLDIPTGPEKPPSMDGDCLFCRIANKKIEAAVVYEDAESLAFRDIHPQAPVHILIIPKKHLPSLADITEQDEKSVGHLLSVAKNLAQKEKLKNGYRVVLNSGAHGGQTVFHLHVHLLGGRSFSWPPG